MREALLSQGWLFKEQHPIGQWIADFALPIHNIIIECDGIYWHSLSDVKKRDAKKDAYLAKDNWTVLRFSGTQIRQNINECINQIAKAVYNP